MRTILIIALTIAAVLTYQNRHALSSRAKEVRRRPAVQRTEGKARAALSDALRVASEGVGK